MVEALRYNPEGRGFDSRCNNATVWTIAHLVWYITNEHRLSLTDYIDFLRRARWKAYKMPRRMRIVGNYLETL